MRKKAIATGATIAIAAMGLLVGLLSSAMLVSSQSMQTSGIIGSVNIGIYSDSACTQNWTDIDWGTWAPRNSTTRTIYVKNTGTVPVKLSMSTANWVPSNANIYLTLTWNRAGVHLEPEHFTLRDADADGISQCRSYYNFQFQHRDKRCRIIKLLFLFSLFSKHFRRPGS